MSNQKFIDEAVKAHNEYRARHQAGPLCEAKDLTQYAQNWADHIASTGQFAHSKCQLSGASLGENIAMKWSSQPEAYSGQEPTDQWYSEIKDYKFGNAKFTSGTGHFTQVVWKGSKEIGIGKAQAKDGSIFVVGSYRPAGNMMGAFAENVLPPKDGKIVLPSEPSKPTKAGGSGAPATGCGGGRGTETRSTRTYTKTVNGVTTTVVEETITKADGSTTTTRKETTSS